MSAHRERKRSGARAKPRPSGPPQPVTSPTWPFKEGRYVDAWLRAHDPERTVDDMGNGVRLYPTRNGNKVVVNAKARRCSNKGCGKLVGDCPHVLEDDFRFGKYSLHPEYRPPSSLIPKPRKLGKKNEKYAKAKRVRPRPNPMVDGVTAATRMRWGREALPLGVPRRAADLANWLRCVDAESRSTIVGPGRPAIDIYDLAVAAMLRAWDNLPYEALTEMSKVWAEQGYITEPFHFNALDGAYGTELLIDVLDRMCQRIERYFRLVATDYACDGTTFSTSRSDNARTERYTGLRVLLHAMYERRWGLLTGFRLTWDRRGRGSGEPLHFPYIVGMTKRTLNVRLVMADGAFASEPNFKFADDQRFELMAPITPSKWNPRTKKLLGEFRAAQLLKEYNRNNPGPRMKQIYPFRNSGEGWHVVFKEQSALYVVSRPDRGNYPLTKDEWEKANPESAYEKLPKGFEERERIIATEQNVGSKVVCEFHARRLAMHLRALVKAEAWYKEEVDFFADRPFEPRPEDEAYSVLRDAV